MLRSIWRIAVKICTLALVAEGAILSGRQPNDLPSFFTNKPAADTCSPDDAAESTALMLREMVEGNPTTCPAGTNTVAAAYDLGVADARSDITETKASMRDIIQSLPADVWPSLSGAITDICLSDSEQPATSSSIEKPENEATREEQASPPVIPLDNSRFPIAWDFSLHDVDSFNGNGFDFRKVNIVPLDFSRIAVDPDGEAEVFYPYGGAALYEEDPVKSCDEIYPGFTDEEKHATYENMSPEHLSCLIIGLIRQFSIENYALLFANTAELYINLARAAKVNFIVNSVFQLIHLERPVETASIFKTAKQFIQFAQIDPMVARILIDRAPEKIVPLFDSIDKVFQLNNDARDCLIDAAPKKMFRFKEEYEAAHSENSSFTP